VEQSLFLPSAGSWREPSYRDFFRLAELNEAIAEKVTDLKRAGHDEIGVSRRELLAKYYRPALRAAALDLLPDGHLEDLHVSIDYHNRVVVHNVYKRPPHPLVFQTSRCVENQRAVSRSFLQVTREPRTAVL